MEPEARDLPLQLLTSGLFRGTVSKGITERRLPTVQMDDGLAETSPTVSLDAGEAQLRVPGAGRK